MKFGIRKPSIKKRIRARTTGKVVRRAKRSISPVYGRKGTGLVRDPKKAVYNKVYNKTSVGCLVPLIAIGSAVGTIISFI